MFHKEIEKSIPLYIMMSCVREGESVCVCFFVCLLQYCTVVSRKLGRHGLVQEILCFVFFLSLISGYELVSRGLGLLFVSFTTRRLMISHDFQQPTCFLFLRNDLTTDAQAFTVVRSTVL